VKRRNKAVEVVVVPENRLTTVTERLAPLVQTATGRLGPLAQSASQRVVPLAVSAAGRVTPLYVSAAGRVTPLYTSVAGRLTPLVVTAAGAIGPYAASARQRGVQAAQDAVGKLGPQVEDALSRVSPAVDAARLKVSDDLVPRLTEALGAAASAPVVVEASKRGRATLAAAKGELTLPAEVPARKASWVKRGALVAALGGVAAVAVRQFLGSKDADWQAARPSAPYAAPRSDSGSGWSAATGTTGTTGTSSEVGPDASSKPPGDVRPAGGEELGLGDVEVAEVPPGPTEAGISPSDPITVLADPTVLNTDESPGTTDRH
jgi:hypothetical protein